MGVKDIDGWCWYELYIIVVLRQFGNVRLFV